MAFSFRPSAGKKYADATTWRLATPLPARVAALTVNSASPTKDTPKLIFAALDSTAAREIEPAFADAGCAVVSNSSAFRMAQDVPLVIPEVNGDHVPLLNSQKWYQKNGGFMVTNPNCSAIGLVMALAPLHRRFGVEKVFVTTMQAVSGAGYPGVPSLDILGNVIPYIASEEEKMEAESRKLLGTLSGNSVKDRSNCPERALQSRGGGRRTHRIRVHQTHKAGYVGLRSSIHGRNFRCLPQKLKLPSAPEEPVIYDPAPDRPQPRLDRDRGRGMSAVVGRLRPCNIFDWRFTVLSHNTIRGAAGAAILNGELLKAQGYLS